MRNFHRFLFFLIFVQLPHPELVWSSSNYEYSSKKSLKIREKIWKHVIKRSFFLCNLRHAIFSPSSQWFKITEKVSFNIASEASYVYILSRQKFMKNAKNGKWGELLKTWNLRSNSVTRQVNLNWTQLMENAKIKNATFLVIFKHCASSSSLKKSWEKQRSASYCRSRSWRRMRKTRSRIPLPQSWLKPACRPTLVTFTKASWSSLSTWGTSRSTAFRRPFWRTKKVSNHSYNFLLKNRQKIWPVNTNFF